MKIAALTSADGYFEDFEVGALIRHARGKTVTEMDNVLITNMVMNTAHGHFNEDAMKKAAKGIFGQRVVFGGINLSMVIGLAAQDTAEHCLRELGMDKIRLLNPVFHGDTVHVVTRIKDMRESKSRPNDGIVTFEHIGYNQKDKEVCYVVRTALMRKRPA